MADPGLASKFIEMQQEDAQIATSIVGRYVDAPDRERREALRLARARTLEQLKRAVKRNHKIMLKRALRHIDNELSSENQF